MPFSNPLLLLLALSALAPSLAWAGSVLLIYPTLVLFEGNQRNAEITLTNRGDETGVYEMSWTHMTMTPDGRVAKYDGEPPWSVQPYVRYSPRRVTLAPAESQTIKMALRRGQDVPEGEYYAHFRVLTLQSGDVPAEEADTASQGVTITARTAVAIPIIWRNSRAASSASIESVRIDADANLLSVDVQRYGSLSVRGFLHLFVSAPDGTPSYLAEPLHFVIYPSIDSRTADIELNEGVRASGLPSGAVLYYSPDEELNDQSILFASYPLVP